MKLVYAMVCAATAFGVRAASADNVVFTAGGGPGPARDHGHRALRSEAEPNAALADKELVLTVRIAPDGGIGEGCDWMKSGALAAFPEQVTD
jgi:hypothetical protein